MSRIAATVAALALAAAFAGCQSTETQTADMGVVAGEKAACCAAEKDAACSAEKAAACADKAKACSGDAKACSGEAKHCPITEQQN